MAPVPLDVSGEERNWAELPTDILSVIFQKLGSIEILFTAQAVCSSWMRFSYEPQVWQRIDMLNHCDIYEFEYDLEKMARAAVDRSCGQLVEFSVAQFGTDDLLQYVADRAGPFRFLRLVYCYTITDEGLIEAAKKFPLLEELEISYCSFSKEVLVAVGRFCPQLKCLRLNCSGYKGIECDEEALAIAENIPKLRHLQLFGNLLTNEGLEAILGGCPHLVSLDLRQCFNVNLEGSLKRSCMEKISYLRLPNDSTDDYGFDTEIGGCRSYDEDYPSGFSDIDILSDDAYYEFSDGSDIHILASEDAWFGEDIEFPLI
ncbi:F-box protein SKIP19-like [Tasmannia lanceolata]|uniref:F-box protein SKIP19-like n=1 Tax=Tasmannia lanceolata TaxID=3420 RepID=UPI004063B121